MYVGVGVLCDRTTYLSARKEARLYFTDLPSLRVKGKSDAIRVYQPCINPSFTIAAPTREKLGIDNFNLFDKLSHTTFSKFEDLADSCYPSQIEINLEGRNIESSLLLYCCEKIFKNSIL